MLSGGSGRQFMPRLFVLRPNILPSNFVDVLLRVDLHQLGWGCVGLRYGYSSEYADNVWASASNLLEEMFSTWGQHLIRLDCAGLAILIVSAVQKCILHLCSITISAIMTPIRLMLFPVCLVPFILYYLRPLCLVALLLTIGFKSLRWRKQTTSALKLVAQGKKQT